MTQPTEEEVERVEQTVEHDAMDDFWFVAEDGHEIAGPFDCEQDAYDWLESFGNDA